MTVELSLRNRSFKYRLFGSIWLMLAIIMLCFTYITLPMVVKNSITITKMFVNTQPSAILEIATVISLIALSLIAIVFACFILGRCAFVDFALSASYNGLADAICISGSKIEDFEKASKIFIPRGASTSMTSILTKKDQEFSISALKSLRP